MSTLKKLFAFAAVAIVIVIAAIASYEPSSVTPQNGTKDTGGSGTQHNTPESFNSGVDFGDGYITFSKSGVIAAGSNQASWRNTTGRTVFVKPENTEIGYTSGTASSSLLFFVATSTGATLSNNYAHPGGSVFGIDGATVATSTPSPRWFNGTTTTSGAVIPVLDGAYLNFQVQEKFACKTVGVCETATSTNRGITNFLVRFTGSYKP